MIACYYKELESSECKWQGDEKEMIGHMIESHEVLSYSACFHNKIVLELILDLESAGFRYVVLEFLHGTDKVLTIFEEFYDEDSKILKLSLRSEDVPGNFYMIKIEGKSSSLEYAGEVLGLTKGTGETQQCLQMHAKQAERFGYLEDGELRYRVNVCLV